MVIKRGLYFSGRGRQATVLRQKRSRWNKVRVARAGYGGGMLTRILNNSGYGSETKSVDIANSTYAVTTTGLVTPLNLIQVGSTFCNRIGRRIEMVSLYMTGQLRLTGSSTATHDYVRVLIVYDRQTNGATPAIATILANYDQTTAQTTNAGSGLNPDQKERFVILADERRLIPPVTATGVYSPTEGDQDIFCIKRFVKLRGVQTHYQGDSSPAVVGDISTGGLFLVTIGLFANTAQPANLNVNFRLRYKDT